MAKTVITVRDISKSFGNIQAVRDLSFAVEAGSCFGFLGPNGAGKTTVMKMIYGKCARDKDCGSLMDIFGYDPAENELAIKYISGVVQQENNLDDELNVIQNLMIYSKFYNIPAKVAKKRIEYLLGFLELSEKADSKIKDLSGGMKMNNSYSITFLYFVSRRHEDERKKKAGPFRPGLWCSALRIYLGKSSSATSATLRSPYIAR